MSNTKLSSDLLLKFSNEIKFRIVNSVIEDLRKLRGSAYMLSGDDTYLKNVWEEYCVDQQEGTNFSDVYLHTIETHIESSLEKCSPNEKNLLYLLTDSAARQIEELEINTICDELDSTQLVIDLQAIIDLIRWDIENEAKEFTNNNIERTLYGEAEEEEEEVEEEDIPNDHLSTERPSLNDEDNELINSTPSIPTILQSEDNSDKDPAELHLMQKMNFIDSRNNRPPSYPEIEVPANFSYHTKEQMDFLAKQYEYKHSFSYKFQLWKQLIGSHFSKAGRYLLFTITCMSVTSLAYYWYVSLKPWINWLEFYIWMIPVIVSPAGLAFIADISPSKKIAKFTTLTFSLSNFGYWMYWIWTADEAFSNLVSTSVASLMICIMLFSTCAPFISKD